MAKEMGNARKQTQYLDEDLPKPYFPLLAPDPCKRPYYSTFAFNRFSSSSQKKTKPINLRHYIQPIPRRDNKSSNKGKGSEKLRSRDKSFNPKFIHWKAIDSILYSGDNYSGKTVSQLLDQLYLVDDDVDDVLDVAVDGDDVDGGDLV